MMTVSLLFLFLFFPFGSLRDMREFFSQRRRNEVRDLCELCFMSIGGLLASVAINVDVLGVVTFEVFGTSVSSIPLGLWAFESPTTEGRKTGREGKI